MAFSLLGRFSNKNSSPKASPTGQNQKIHMTIREKRQIEAYPQDRTIDWLTKGLGAFAVGATGVGAAAWSWAVGKMNGAEGSNFPTVQEVFTSFSVGEDVTIASGVVLGTLALINTLNRSTIKQHEQDIAALKPQQTPQTRLYQPGGV